jgi:hypothetical protein
MVSEQLTLNQSFSDRSYADVNYYNANDEHYIKVYHAKELKHLIHTEVPAEHLLTFQQLETLKGKPVFDAQDIVKLYQNGINVIDLQKTLSRLDSDEISRKILLHELYNQEYRDWKKEIRSKNYIFSRRENFDALAGLSLLGKSDSFFKDTDKPNLLITYPGIDSKKAFYSSSARKMIETLSLSYDIWFVTLHSEKDLYKSIRKVPSIDLLILSGHGTSTNIQIGVPVEGFEDLSYIDMNDRELKRYLKRLPKYSTIFLNSCSTGEGSGNNENLANKVANLAPGRKVISATAPFALHEVSIQNAYPLQLKIPGKTYITEK